MRIAKPRGPAHGPHGFAAQRVADTTRGEGLEARLGSRLVHSFICGEFYSNGPSFFLKLKLK